MRKLEEKSHFCTILIAALTLYGIISEASYGRTKEFLTAKEIELIQDTRAIEQRTRIYMDAAAVRLKTAEERLSGKESEAGDPMEFFTPEDLVDAYCQILRSVMLSTEDAFQVPRRKGNENVGKALKILKEETEKARKELDILKRMAEEKKREPLWNGINQAIDITNGAHDGAEEGLSRLRPQNPAK